MNSKCEFFIVKLILFMLLFGSSNVTIAQITKVKTIQEETPEQEVAAPYDSLKNICWENFRSQVGQILYLNDDAISKEWGVYSGITTMPRFEYSALVRKNWNMRYLPDSIIYKFTIGKGQHGSDYESVVGKYYYVNRLIEDPKNGSKKSGSNYSYELIMKDTPYDTVYYDFSSYVKFFGTFINTGYIEKLKQKYVGKELIINEDDSGLEKIGTGKYEKIPKGTHLKCTDISIEDGNQYHILLLLHHDKYGDFYADLTLGVEMERLDTPEMYKVRLQKETALARKYGKVNADLIIRNQVRTGWSKAMCRESWGAPKSVNVMSGAGGTTEQWVYSSSCYLYFKNGILTTIQY
ncbi:hypothetical protein [Bacteroides sp.]|uniref:hypothetical protein n=1 Tax=Bacteroides sp. TaxID=29523 RepID=UPI0025B8F294|nr:hypothetical protein [Bacteroides sp.]